MEDKISDEERELAINLMDADIIGMETDRKKITSVVAYVKLFLKESTRKKIMEVLDDCGVDAWDLMSIADPRKVAYGIIADQVLDDNWKMNDYWCNDKRKQYGRKEDHE